MLGASLLAASEARAQDSSPLQAPPSNDDSTPAADPVPTMFPHPESDRWWISGQANFISQWHPAFHSPYQGPRSLPPQAQDATSRVLTLFTGVRLTDTMELAQRFREEAVEWAEVGEERGPMAETLALWVTAQLGVATRQVRAAQGKERWRMLRELVADVVKLRAGNQSLQRMQLEWRRLELERAKLEGAA